MEIWKDIKGYNGVYKISNYGRVKSLKEGIISGKERIIKNTLNGSNYYQVCLYKKGVQKIISIHRLVALHFIENPFNYNVVNHIDANTKNNSIQNLEWCTTKHNFNHCMKLGNIDFRKYKKSVKRVCIKTGEFKIYDALNDVKKDGFSSSAVSRCANNKKHCKTHKKYKWVFI